MREAEKQLAEQQAAFCRVFANASRIMILWVLTEGEKSVGGIAEELGLSLQSTSQHLSLMRTCGLLATRREGQSIYYRLAEDSAAYGCHLVNDAHKELASAD